MEIQDYPGRHMVKAFHAAQEIHDAALLLYWTPKIDENYGVSAMAERRLREEFEKLAAALGYRVLAKAGEKVEA